MKQPEAVPWYTERDLKRGWRRLILSLQLIGARPAMIRSLYAPIQCFAEEWPISFFAAHGYARVFLERGLVTETQLAAINALNDALHPLWCIEGAPHWQSQDAEPKPKWSECRRGARELLSSLGIPQRTRWEWLLWGNR